MAVKPIISSMTPWDATSEYQLKFTYAGGTPLSNRLTIYDANSGSMVYDNTEIGSHLYHTISANTLTNGFRYKAHLIVTETNNITSIVSDDVYFWCFATPVFRYVAPSIETIDNPYVTLWLNYNQSEGEKLYSYIHKLYNYSKQVIDSTETIYNTSNIVSVVTTYTFKGLSNKTHYYLQSEGVTKNGIPLKTEMKHIFIDFEQEQLANVLNLYSDSNATVTGNLNIIAINADESSDDYTYIGSQVVLIDKDIHYNNNFEIVGDFTCSLKARQTLGNKQLLVLSKKNTSGFIQITSNLIDTGVVVYRLRVNNGLSDYNLFSDPMNITDDTEVVIHIRRKNNIYKLIVQRA